MAPFICLGKCGLWSFRFLVWLCMERFHSLVFVCCVVPCGSSSKKMFPLVYLDMQHVSRGFVTLFWLCEFRAIKGFVLFGLCRGNLGCGYFCWLVSYCGFSGHMTQLLMSAFGIICCFFLSLCLFFAWQLPESNATYMKQRDERLCMLAQRCPTW